METATTAAAADAAPKPRKIFKLKPKPSVPEAPAPAVADMEAKPRRVFKLKPKPSAVVSNSVPEPPAPEPPSETSSVTSAPKKRLTLRKKKPSWAMTDDEALEDAVRTWYLMHGEAKIPEEDATALKELAVATAAETTGAYTVPADSALAWELTQDYPDFWLHEFVPPTSDPRWARMEAIQKGMPVPPPLTEEQQEAIDDSVPPPYGTKEFWGWIMRRKARINKERAEKGLPPLPSKKEKEAAAAKKKEEREAAKAAKAAAKGAKATKKK